MAKKLRKIIIESDNSGYKETEINEPSIKQRDLTGLTPETFFQPTELPGYSTESGYNKYGQSKYDEQLTSEYFKPNEKGISGFEYQRGEKQDLSDKWVNGITKAAGIAGTSILENTAGLVYGIGSAINNQDISKLYKNDFTDVLDETNNYIASAMPNYHTKAEEDYNLLQKAGTANFWSEQFLSGAGYMAGAIATGAGLNKLASLGKLVRAGKVVDEAALAAKGFSELDRAAKGIRIADAVDFGKNAILMSHGESAIEARGIYDDTKAQLTKDFIDKYGEDKLDEQAKSVIEANAKAASNWGYATNLAITGTTNALLFPKLLSEGYGANKVKLNNIELLSGKFIPETKNLASGVSKELLLGSLEEGGQELGQLLTQKTLTDYYSQGFKDKKDQHSMVESLVYGLEQTLGTEEGLENFFLGALMGGPAGAIQARGEINNQNQKTAQIAELLNNPKVKQTINSFSNFVRATNYEQDKNEALAKGSKFDYLNSEFNQNKSIAKQFIDNNATDLLISQYEDMKGLSEEEFKKVAGYEADKPLPKSQLEIINDAVSLVKTLDKTNSSIKELFPYNQEIHKSPDNYNILTTNLWHYSTSIDNINKRVKQVQNDIFKVASDKSVNIQGDGITIPFSVQDNPLVAQQINQANQDLQVAKLYKDKLIESYNLLANPQTQEKTLNDIKRTAEQESTKIQEKENTDSPTEKVQESTIQEFADRIKSGEKLTTPEDIQFYENNKEQIENKLKEEFIFEPSIDESKVQIQYIQPQDTGKKALTANKGNNGVDDGTKEANERFFRYINKNDVTGFNYQVVTKNNNPKLYNELLALRSSEKDNQGLTPKQFEDNYKQTKGREYQGIYLVLTDPKGSVIKVQDKPLFSTLTRVSRGVKGEILVDEDELENLVRLRDKLLEQKDTNIYLPIIGKSKGIPQFLPRINDLRQSHNIETSFGSIKDINLELPTVKGAKLSTGQVADLGKLYLINNDKAVDLIPRTVNSEESDIISNLIAQRLGIISQTVSNPSTEIEKLIFFGIPKSGVREFTIGVNKDGSLQLGLNTILTKEQLSTPEGVKVLKDFLSTKHIHVNNKYGWEDIFEEPRVDDSHTVKKYNSYKEFLLSGDQPMFGTDLVPSTEVQYRNQYLIFDPNFKTNNLPDTQEEIVETLSLSNPEIVKDEDIKLNVDEIEEIEKSAEDTDLNKVFQKKGNISRKIDLDRLTSIVSNPETKLSQAELNWFKNTFPNIPIKTVKGLIENKSFGRFLESSKVLLSDEAPTGTLYHEAFHAVTQLYLTPSEIDGLYRETGQKLGITDRLQIEEALAEDFANYKETGKILSGTIKRNTIFRRLLNFIKSLFNLPANSIQEIYDRIDKGYYTNKDIVGNREFTSLDRSLPGFSEIKTRELLDGIDATFFDIIFENNKTPNQAFSKQDRILDIIYNEFIDRQEQIKKLNKKDSTSQRVEALKSYNYILENWSIVKEAWAKRLNSFGISVDLNEELDPNLDNSLDINEDNDERQGDIYKASNEISSKSIMSKSTKLLIKSLKQKNQDQTDKLNSLGLPQVVNFNNTYNFLLKELVGLNTYQAIYNKIESLSKTRPEFVELLNRIGKSGDEISLEQLLFQNQFRQDFDKNKYNSFITLINANGEIYSIDATKQITSDRIKERWRNNLRDKSKLTDQGELSVPLDLINISDNIEFLNRLGINLSKEAIDNIDKKQISESVQVIKNFIKDNNGIVTNLFESKSGIEGRVSSLLQAETDFSTDTAELSYISTEGKTVYSISQNNMLSIVKNIINNSKTKEELFSKLPHLNTVTTENSLYLSQLFDNEDNKRKGVELLLDLHDGLKTNNDIENKIANKTSSLSTGDKYVQEINNLLLYGKSSYIRASDKPTEHTISLNQYGKNQRLPIPIENVKDNFNNSKIKEIFQGYFKDEVKRISLFELSGLGSNIDQYNKVGGEFTIFESILSEKVKNNIFDRLKELKTLNLSEPEILNEINNLINSNINEVDVLVSEFLNKYSNEIKNDLEKYKVLENGISSELKSKYTNEQLLKAIAVNHFINSVEQTKLFIGDMSFYKDLFKRTAGAVGTKETTRVDEDINSWLNNNNKRLDKKQASGKVNVVVFADSKQRSNYLNEYIDTLMSSTPDLTRSEAENLLKPYTKMEEGDAQGWITLDELREFRIRRGEWNQKIEDAWNKAQKGETLTKEELVYLKVEKAQYFGPQDYNNLFVPTYHKFSLMPLIPNLVKGKNLEKLLAKMTEEQVGYSLFKSGSKVGTKLGEDGKATNFYDHTNSGNINDNNWTKEVVDYNFLGIQTKTSDPKEKVIFGTQFRKLLFTNLFENGKEQFKGANDLFKEYSDIISNEVEKAKSKLIKELGINPETYKSEDVTKVIELLKKEAEDRNLSNNIIDALQSELIDNKLELKYNFDAMVNKDRIDSMLTAIVNSRLIRQKVNGDAMVQGSVAGFESIGIRQIGSNSSLKFYTQDKDKTKPAECKIVLSGQYKQFLKEYGTLDKINEAIKSNKIDEKLLHIIGYRIPTQGLNSMEFLKITEFLPEESGTLIVLPTEIVAKSGGDFDIDKLNIFRPNIYSKTQDFEYLYKNIKSLVDEDYTRFNDIINDNSAESNLIKDIFHDAISESKFEKETLDEFKVSKEELNKLKELISNKAEVENIYKSKNNHNRIIEITTEVLSNSYNFTSLITPNSTKILTDIVEEIRYINYRNKKLEKTKKYNKKEKIQSFEDYIANKESRLNNIRYTDQLKLTTQIDQFSKFMLAKGMIGTSALRNTHHTLSQIVGATLNKEYIVDDKTKQVLINFPHHETKDNKLDISKIKDVNNKHQISEIYSQAINATVDAAKDPFFKDLNMTQETLGVYLYLTKLGVPFENIAYFLKQPIISKYLDEISINKSAFLNASGNNLSTKDLVDSIIEEYKSKIEDVETITNQFFDKPELLKEYLNSDKQNSQEFYKTQVQVLEDFLKYKEQSQLLSEAIAAVNHDTSGLGRNLEAARLKVEQIDKAKRTNFFNGIDDILNNTFIGAFNQHKFAIDTYGQFYYTQTEDIQNNIKTLVDVINPFEDKNKIKLTTLIENDFINYVVQNYGYRDIKGLQNKLFNTESVAKEIIRIKNNPKTQDEIKLSNNILIKELFPLLADPKSNKKIDNIKVFAKRYDTFTANQLTEGFREVKELNPTLAKNLMDLGIIQSGLNNSPITYLGIIPYEYYNDLVKKAFNEFNKNTDKSEDFKIFNQLFFRNNPYDSIVGKKASKLKLGVTRDFTSGIVTSDNSLGYGMYGKDYNKDKYDNDLTTIYPKSIPEESNYLSDDIENNEYDNENPQFSKKRTDFVAPAYLNNGKAYFKTLQEANNKVIDLKRIYPVVNKPFQVPSGMWVVNVPMNQFTSNQFPQHSFVTEKTVDSKLAAETLAKDLSSRLNVDVEFIDDERAKEILGDKYAPSHGFYYKGKAYIVDINLDTVLHEMSHPFIDALETNNNPLFMNIMEQVINEHPEIYDLVEAEYPEDFTKDKDGKTTPNSKAYKEMAVRAITKLGIENINRETGKVKTGLERLWEAIKDIFVSLFGNTNLKSLSPNTTLRELANLITTFEGTIDLGNLKLSGETQFEKEEKVESPFVIQENFFTKRIKTLEKQLKQYKEGTPAYERINTELEKIKSKFDSAVETKDPELFKELGEHTLDQAESYIKDLEENIDNINIDIDSNRFADKVEYANSVVKVWIEDEELASRAIKLRKKLFPFIQKNNYNLINKFSTKKNGVTQKEIDDQNKDIDSLKKFWGALVDVPNYIVNTIGSIIKSSQNKIETENKKVGKEIQEQVDSLIEWSKKNGVKLNDLYDNFIQEHKGNLILTKEYLSDGSINPNWTKIQNTPELLNFYNFYKEKLNKAQEQSGLQSLGDHFIPNLRKRSISKTLQRLNPIKTIKFSDLNKNEELISDVVPFEFNKKIPIEEKSRDLGNSLLEFATFANSHEEMSNILPKVRLLQEELLHKKLPTGEVVKRTFIKSSNPNLNINAEDSNLYAMSKLVIEMQVKGEMKLVQGRKKIEDITDEEGNIIGEKYVDLTDLADNMLQYNSLLRVGLSPIGSVVNVAIGDASSFIESVGGRFFNTKGLHQAGLIFTRQNLKEESELNKWLLKLNPLQELESYQEIKQGVTDILGKLSGDNLKSFMFSPQKWGEKWIQSRIMIAMLIKEGYMNSKGETTKKGEDLTSEELSKLADKVHFVIDQTQGRYSAKDAATAQRHILYRMLIQFRKFIPAAIESRLGEYNPHSNRAGVSTEGRYRTLGKKVIKTALKGQFQEAFSNMLLPLISAKKALEKGNLTETEIYNMRKNAAELLTIAALMLLYGGLRGGDEDKDKKWRRKPLVKTGLSLLNRAAGDLEFFYSPDQLNHLVQNSIPLSKTFGDILITFEHIPAAFYLGDYEYKKGSRKGENKFYNNVERLIPGIKVSPELKRLLNDQSLEEIK